MDALTYEGFNRDIDRLFSVGDLIDRGPESEKCLTLLREPWFFMVRGNHEDMLINACGGDGESYNWWSSYGAWAKSIENDEMENWAKLFRSFPVAITLEAGACSVGICHAEPDGQDWEMMRNHPDSTGVMLWGRRVLRNPPDYNVEGVDFTVHGHTPLDQPAWVGNRYFMDTGAGHGQKLTLRKIDDIWAEYQLRQIL